MKPSVRPLFTTLLLIFMALALTFRFLLNHSSENKTDRYPQKPIELILNTTLLNLATIDVGEPVIKKDVESLLEGRFENFTRQRSFLSSGRYRFGSRDRSAGGIPGSIRSPEFYRQWLDIRRHLNLWYRNRRFQSDIMLHLVSLVKGPIDKYKGVMGGEGKYKTCAVVGNSGILLKSEHGELIDSHEVVIRLNNARTWSFERNVGTKTSFSFINSNILQFCARREGCSCHPYGPDVPIVMYMCQAVQFLDYTYCNSSHRAPLLITDPRFDVLCARIVKYYSLKRFMEKTGKGVEAWFMVHDGPNFHYSSGMQAVMLALGICDKVNIFGFGKSGSAKHHYHSNQQAELDLHDYEAEYDLYRDLVERPEVVPFISTKVKFPPLFIYQ